MRILLMLCILLSSLTMDAQQSLAGIWNTGNDNTKIEITAVNDVYEGKIVSSDNAKAKIGKLLLKEVQLVDGEWKGKLFAAKRGKWMDAVLKEKNNQLQVTVKAGWRSKTLEWRKE